MSEETELEVQNVNDIQSSLAMAKSQLPLTELRHRDARQVIDRGITAMTKGSQLRELLDASITGDSTVQEDCQETIAIIIANSIKLQQLISMIMYHHALYNKLKQTSNRQR